MKKLNIEFKIVLAHTQLIYFFGNIGKNSLVTKFTFNLLIC